jgi:hypothetical protein
MFKFKKIICSTIVKVLPINWIYVTYWLQNLLIIKIKLNVIFIVSKYLIYCSFIKEKDFDVKN